MHRSLLARAGWQRTCQLCLNRSLHPLQSRAWDMKSAVEDGMLRQSLHFGGTTRTSESLLGRRRYLSSLLVPVVT